MTFERAVELVEAVNSYKFFVMGICERVRRIGDATLEELCEAAKMVREAPAETMPDGSKRHRVHPSDRFIAAVYVAENYRSQSCENPLPIIKLPSSSGKPVGSALVHVNVED